MLIYFTYGRQSLTLSATPYADKNIVKALLALQQTDRIHELLALKSMEIKFFDNFFVSLL